MSVITGRASVWVLFCLCCQAQSRAAWALAKTAHFEVFSQSGTNAARTTATWLEQLRVLFVNYTGFQIDHAPPVRVIAFRSVEDYEPFRLRDTSDAYYVGAEARDYIVMPSPGAEAFRLAAHEYAHSLLHASGLKLPHWLSEGLAEILSTVKVSERASSIGGDLPARSRTLGQLPWMPLSELLSRAVDPASNPDRESTSMFYAESWSLTSMLWSAPAYAPGFTRFVAAVNSGQDGAAALSSVYGKDLDEVARDLRIWRGSRPVPLAGAPAAALVETSTVSDWTVRSVQAEVLAAIGQWERAEILYRELLREEPRDAQVHAALGAIAFERSDPNTARREWERAMELGVTDAGLCYRYAALASNAGAPAAEVRRAYQRAVELKPDYDDARYQLALVDMSAEDYTAAVEQLRQMRTVTPERQYPYWCTMADALTQLGRRQEAVQAAKAAAAHAASPEDRAYAVRLAHIALTDLGVRFARDASGRAQMVTTRVPHGATDFNPFIEPDDDIRTARGALREIDCGGLVILFRVETAAGMVTVSIPDLLHLQARNAPAEFTCGPQPGAVVTLVYAAGSGDSTADGILRGIEFQ